MENILSWVFIALFAAAVVIVVIALAGFFREMFRDLRNASENNQRYVADLESELVTDEDGLPMDVLVESAPESFEEAFPPRKSSKRIPKGIWLPTLLLLFAGVPFALDHYWPSPLVSPGVRHGIATAFALAALKSIWNSLGLKLPKWMTLRGSLLFLMLGMVAAVLMIPGYFLGMASIPIYLVLSAVLLWLLVRRLRRPGNVERTRVASLEFVAAPLRATIKDAEVALESRRTDVERLTEELDNLVQRGTIPGDQLDLLGARLEKAKEAATAAGLELTIADANGEDLVAEADQEAEQLAHKKATRVARLKWPWIFARILAIGLFYGSMLYCIDSMGLPMERNWWAIAISSVTLLVGVVWDPRSKGWDVVTGWFWLIGCLFILIVLWYWTDGFLVGVHDEWGILKSSWGLWLVAISTIWCAFTWGGYIMGKVSEGMPRWLRRVIIAVILVGIPVTVYFTVGFGQVVSLMTSVEADHADYPNSDHEYSDEELEDGDEDGDSEPYEDDDE